VKGIDEYDGVAGYTTIAMANLSTAEDDVNYYAVTRDFTLSEYGFAAYRYNGDEKYYDAPDVDTAKPLTGQYYSAVATATGDSMGRYTRTRYTIIDGVLTQQVTLTYVPQNGSATPLE
jgi:hypothetical protein